MSDEINLLRFLWCRLTHHRADVKRNTVDPDKCVSITPCKRCGAHLRTPYQIVEVKGWDGPWEGDNE